jgi:hypothetical protein
MRLIDFTYNCLGTKFRASTTRKRHSFIGIDEYIQIIFVGPETDEYKLIFVGFNWAPTNMWPVWFDFYRTHIFVGKATSPTNIGGI